MIMDLATEVSSSATGGSTFHNATGMQHKNHFKEDSKTALSRELYSRCNYITQFYHRHTELSQVLRQSPD